MYQDPYTSKYIVKKVEGIQDLKTIEYCMFCGKNIYKEEMRYDTTGPGWGRVYLCGEKPKTPSATDVFWNMDACGRVAYVS